MSDIDEMLIWLIDRCHALHHIKHRDGEWWVGLVVRTGMHSYENRFFSGPTVQAAVESAVEYVLIFRSPARQGVLVGAELSE